MKKESKLIPIAPDALPALLTRLRDEQVADFALVGQRIDWLSASTEERPEELQGRVVYVLIGHLSGLPDGILRLDRLENLTLWSLGLKGTTPNISPST